MSPCRDRRSILRPVGRALACSKSRCWRKRRESDAGFTLIELLIVTAVIPLIIGALAIGLVSIFSLETGAQNRLSDSGDAQIVTSTYLSDVEGAGFITTQSSSQPQCGTGDQLLGLGSNFNSITSTFETSISYVSVANGDGTFSLVRDDCTNGSTTPSTETTLSVNLPSSQAPPTVSCNTTPCDYATSWVTTQDITKVEFAITETHAKPASTFSYTVAAVPQASATVVVGGQPINSSTQAGCGFASAGSGTYASTLCLVDFAALTGNNLLAAEQGCLEMQVTLPGNDELYFCVGITGAPVAPATLPTYPEAFLGNTSGGSPFYTNIPGSPALYQNCEGGNSSCGADNYNGDGRTIVTFSGITVVNSNNVPATGWEAVSADAETTDNGESISWTSNTKLYVLSNGFSYDTSADPVGNACDAGAGLTGNGTDTVTCNGNGTTGALKNGTPMVWALTPDTMTATMIGTGLEAISFGLILS
jgi:prepilin-type N-terminal cleavage/methylation domain-containing protein